MVAFVGERSRVTSAQAVPALTMYQCRFIGVTDIASVRFSLPAQLLEPTPNLGTTTDSCLLEWRSAENTALILYIRVLELSRPTRDVHKAR